MIIGTRNWLDDFDADDVWVPDAAVGYATENLWQGGTAQAWRSLNATTTHTFNFLTTADRPVDLIAMFDVRAIGADVTSITVRHRDGWLIGTLTDVGEIDLSARGDGALSLGVPVPGHSWVVTVSLSTTAALTIGGIWLGLAAAVASTPASLSQSRQGNAVVNVSEAKTRRAARLASTTRSFDISWPALEEQQGAEVLAVFDALAGSASPCVVVPDGSDMTGAYYGRIADGIGFQMDAARLHFGHGITFEEDGRALGG